MRVGEVDGGVVDDLVGTQSFDKIPFAAVGCRDHVRTERLRDLDRDMADAPGSVLVSLPVRRRGLSVNFGELT